jgi:hypothetical protein
VADDSTSDRVLELDRRLAGGLEVILLWHPGSDTLRVHARDATIGDDFELEVVPDEALEVFRHPYAYAGRAAGATIVG